MKLLDFSYPKSESKREILLSSVFIGFFTYLFLIVFQPFGTQGFPFSELSFILIPYAVFTTLIFTLINLYFFERQTNWTITKEILKLILIVFFCSVFSHFYNTLIISEVEVSFVNFLFMVFYAFSIAVPLCSVYVLLRFIYLNRENQNNAVQISKNLSTSKQNLSAEGLKNKIKIQDEIFEEDNLLFVESADNYCTFYYLKNTKPEKILLRATLKSVEQQIESKKILRCHRSYIVNLEKVKSLRGNAQGYKLTIKDNNFVVPVSRKYLKLVGEILKP